MKNQQRRTDDTATRLLSAIHDLEAERDEWEFVEDGEVAEPHRAHLTEVAITARFIRTAYIDGSWPKALAAPAITSARRAAENASIVRLALAARA